MESVRKDATVVDGQLEVVYPRTAIQYCRVCGFPMPEVAIKCTKCSSWTKRHWISMTQTTLSLLVALFSVLGALAPHLSKLMFRNSDTRASVVSGDEQDLTVALSNSGPRTSAVRDGYAALVNLPIPAVPRLSLRLMSRKDSSPIVMPEKESQVYLRADTFQLARVQRRTFEKWISTGVVEVTVNVQESSDDVHHTTPRTDIIAAKYIERWLINRVDWKR